jgi:hypothetical protein
MRLARGARDARATEGEGAGSLTDGVRSEADRNAERRVLENGVWPRAGPASETASPRLLRKQALLQAGPEARFTLKRRGACVTFMP